MRDSVPLGRPAGSKIMGSINLAVSTYDVLFFFFFFLFIN